MPCHESHRKQRLLHHRLDAAIDSAIAENRIVGTSVIVAENGRIAYRRAAGLADREAGRPVQDDTIFRLASVTKPIVTAALMQLVEAGQIALDDPVTRFLPAFRPRLPDGSEPTITIHQLLTHTSGLSYRFLEPEGSTYHELDISDGLDQPGLGLAENLVRLAKAPLAYAPGQDWRYSLGTDVIGGVIEAVTGRSLNEVVAERITGPLGMGDTAFGVRDLARLSGAYADGTPEPVTMTDGIAVPLFGTFTRFAPSRILDPASYPSGGAGLAGTIDDLFTFFEAIRLGGAPILKSQTIATMLADHVGPTSQVQNPGWGFGYGWSVLGDTALADTPQTKGTIQWGGAYGHNWFIDPARNLTVIALTNTAFEGMAGRFPLDIRNAVYSRA